jgi:hypothetical protein
MARGSDMGRGSEKPGRSTAENLLRVNVALIVVLGLLLAVCVVKALWFPALVFAGLIGSNVLQIALRRRDSD